jgi:hypothetical protein
MIDESDPVVAGMKARFEEISARHRQNVTETMADYEKGEERNQAAREEVARREAEMMAPPPPLAPRNPWLTRRTARPAAASEDGSETGYYSNNWMQ